MLGWERSLGAPLLASMLAGCVSVHVPDARDNPPIEQALVAHLRAPQAIRLVNGYDGTANPPIRTIQIPDRITTFWVIDQKKLTDVGIAMLRKAMEKQGITIDDSAPKTVTFYVQEPSGKRLSPAPGAALWTHARGEIVLLVRFGEESGRPPSLYVPTSGTAKVAIHSDPSAHQAFVGAVRKAIEALLVDEAFIDYVNGQSPLAASRPAAVVPGFNDELYDPEAGFLKEPSEEKGPPNDRGIALQRLLFDPALVAYLNR